MQVEGISVLDLAQPRKLRHVVIGGANEEGSDVGTFINISFFSSAAAFKSLDFDGVVAFPKSGLNDPAVKCELSSLRVLATPNFASSLLHFFAIPAPTADDRFLGFLFAAF